MSKLKWLGHGIQAFGIVWFVLGIIGRMGGWSPWILWGQALFFFGCGTIIVYIIQRKQI